jgi:hypothetical protein
MDLSSDILMSDLDTREIGSNKIIQIDSYILCSKKNNKHKNNNITKVTTSYSEINEQPTPVPSYDNSQITKIINTECKNKNPISNNIVRQLQNVNRLIVSSDKWIFDETDFLFETQFENIKNIYENNEYTTKMNIYIKEITKKISGYRSQDVLKNKYDKSLFVDLQYIISLLFHCNLDCFYCKRKVSMIYETVREPKQWSLERIDNNAGHNKDNVEISCLSCNLRRRTMYHRKYLITKQLENMKKINI